MNGIPNMRKKGCLEDSCDSGPKGKETRLEEKETKIDRMIHESDNLGKDSYNGKGFGVELMKIKKTKQTKMIFNSRENSSVTSICIIIIM